MSHRYKFSLRNDTALFMHGADPEQRAEIRAPAIKAAARYWFRAALGPSVTDDELRQREADVFGSTQRRGVSFSVEVAEGTGRRLLLPQKTEERMRSPRPAIEAGRTFTLTIDGGIAPGGGERAEQAARAFVLAAKLGGFGQRARRGAGSLRITACASDPPATWLGPMGPPRGLQDLADSLRECVHSALESLGGLRNVQGTGVPRFPMLAPRAPKIARIRVGLIRPGNEEQVARRALMIALRDHKDPAFGHIAPRHASAVWLRLCELADGRFATIATAMRSATVTGNWDVVNGFLDAMPEGIDVEIA